MINDMFTVKGVGLGVLALVLLSGCAGGPVVGAVRNPWREVTGPAPVPPGGVPQAIGGYAGGCVRGAASLTPDGPGYQVMRLTRGRFYGHPTLIRYLQELGQTVARRKLGTLLIGDIGQPRGGPTLSSHRSHQNGLDVDIWYWQPPAERGAKARSLTLEERETLESKSVVETDRIHLKHDLWSLVNIGILKTAAESKDVERIFVNAAVKRELCEKIPKKRGLRGWLEKIRPWNGHDDHFHVRLRCPPGDVMCKSQEVVPPGDGCDSTLDWWFTAEAFEKAKAAEAEGPAPMPVLPQACTDLLKL